jgi:hypothetical protein
VTALPYTREAFDRRRAAVKQIESREGRRLALVSVGLGVAQWAGFRWVDARFEHARATAIEGGVFLAYLAVVAGLLWRMQRRLRFARPTCPRCGVVLKDLSERVAVATGRCDACGGQVVA